MTVNNQPLVIKAPPWLPGEFRALLKERGRVEVAFRFTGPERSVYRKRKMIPVSEWAEKYRMIKTSSLPGPWRNDVTPYLVGVMDAAVFPGVQEIVLCKAPQVGGSEAIHNVMGRMIDLDPGPAMYVFPDQLTAEENATDRIIPMITSSVQLRKYTTGYKDDLSKIGVNLSHMKISLAWPTPSRLGNKPIRFLILDELDKFTDKTTKREAGPIALAEKRTTTFPYNRLIIKISTPTVEDGAIWVALGAAQVIFDYWVRCPDCGGYQLMDFDRIKWPEEQRDPLVVEAGFLAGYVCEHCGSVWDDGQRDRAVKFGQWRARDTGQELFGYLKERRPAKIGFHVPSWISPFVSLSSVAADFLRGLKDKDALKNFMNAHKAVPWVNYEENRSVDRILALRDDRKRGQVPGGGQVAVLIGTADTQDNGFWYEIRAWGYGMDMDSWQIREGFVETLEGLEKVFWQDVYRDAQGNGYLVQAVGIDSMGHRTAEIYDWCRKNLGKAIPLRGEQRMNTPYRFARIDFYPGTQKPFPAGVKRLHVNASHYKNYLASKLEVAPADPGAWHLHGETTGEWANQLTAEYLDERGLWQCPKHRANHGWDCSYNQLAMAEMMGTKYMEPPKADPVKPAPEKPRPTGARAKPSWRR